jgi:hypothetical protein
MLEHVSAWLEPLQSVALVALHVGGGAGMLHEMLSGFATSRTTPTCCMEASHAQKCLLCFVATTQVTFTVTLIAGIWDALQGARGCGLWGIHVLPSFPCAQAG